MLIAYDHNGHVIATLDSLVTHGPDGPEARDFEAETEHVGYFNVTGAKGSKHWPGELPNVHSYRVELAGEPGAKHIAALVHRESGARIERP